MAPKHKKISGKSDGPDATDINASDYNDDHIPDGWEFLGRAALGTTGSQIDLTLNMQRKRMIIYVKIMGYSSSGVARVLFGGAAIDTTAANYWTKVSDDNAAFTSVNRVGIPIAQTPITGMRYIKIEIMNNIPSVSQPEERTFFGSGVSGSPGAQRTKNDIWGAWANTTDMIKLIRINAYATLTAESAVNMLAGSDVYAIGRDDN